MLPCGISSETETKCFTCSEKRGITVTRGPTKGSVWYMSSQKEKNKTTIWETPCTELLTVLLRANFSFNIPHVHHPPAVKVSLHHGWWRLCVLPVVMATAINNQFQWWKRRKDDNKIKYETRMWRLQVWIPVSTLCTDVASSPSLCLSARASVLETGINISNIKIVRVSQHTQTFIHSELCLYKEEAHSCFNLLCDHLCAGEDTGHLGWRSKDECEIKGLCMLPVITFSLGVP